MEDKVWDEWDTQGTCRTGYGMSGIPGVGRDRVWDEWDTRGRWRTGYGMSGIPRQ